MGVQLKRASHFILFIVLLPGLSVGVAWLSNAAVKSLVPSEWTFLIDSVGAMGAYGLLFAAFDRSLWRLTLFRSLGVVDAPDMSGRWVGHLRSSHDDHATEYEAALEVRQKFTSIRVSTYFVGSQSASLIAGFAEEPNGQLALHYEYQNVPIADAARSMHIHYGTATLQCVPDQARVHGHYYNWGRDERGHVGTMEFAFESAQLIHRLRK